MIYSSVPGCASSMKLRSSLLEVPIRFPARRILVEPPGLQLLRDFERATADLQLDRAVAALLEYRRERSLRVAGEARVELGTLYLGVERIGAADAQRFGHERLFGFVRELEHHSVGQ